MAVSLVFVDHTLKYLGRDRLLSVDTNQIGHLGVFWFFVHTSLVLMQSLQREWNATPDVTSWRKVLAFYVRRGWRIYPLSIVVVGLVVLARIPAQSINVNLGHVGTMIPFSGPLRDIVANLALVQDVTGSPNTIGVLWSLPLELRMYIVLPILFMIWLRARSPWIMLSLWAISAAWIAAGLPRAGFSVVPYVPCFLAGVVAFAIQQQGTPRKLPGWVWVPLLITIATLSLLAPVTAPTRWIGCLALGLVIPHVRDIRSSWLRLPAAEIARYSYGIYLLHVPILWLTIGHMSTAPLIAQLVVFVSSVALATYLGHWLIENPGLSLGKRAAARVVGQRRGRTNSSISALAFGEADAPGPTVLPADSNARFVTPFSPSGPA